jgi:hypothetical protein
MFSEAII